MWTPKRQVFAFCPFPSSYLEHIYDAGGGTPIWDKKEISRRLKAVSEGMNGKTEELGYGFIFMIEIKALITKDTVG